MSIELASAAIGMLLPYLTEAGKEASKTVGREAAESGLKVLGWMRERLTGRAKEAFSELEEEPNSQLNQDDLRIQLAKLLEKQPGLASQLRELLSEGETKQDIMNQKVGEHGKAIQIKGAGNKASIGD